MSTFRQHGLFTAHVEGRILITEVTGPWNLEMIENWARHVYPMAKALAADGPHVSISIIRESMFCPPDAFDALRRTVEFGVSKLHLLGQLNVADQSVEGRGFLESTYARIYEGTTHR